ncbi:MAG: phosphoribosylanthranilate isomerase [Bacteroidaceae bacterium]|nr:phosphoribosylanthranilate isomerase [Bacteroidaceae bacterium]
MNYEFTIKVCGMRDADDIRAVEALGVDWMGFIFHPASPRFVDSVPAYLPQKAKRVGVFVNAELDYVRRMVDTFGLDIVQLHGSESPAYLAALSDMTIIKAINIATAADFQKTDAYNGLADYFLFDTKAKLAGGNGTQFDWDLLQDYSGQTPFLLSGGIGPDDAMRLRDFHHPRLAGIDLNSRFELSPALKDTTKLQNFIDNFKKAYKPYRPY